MVMGVLNDETESACERFVGAELDRGDATEGGTSTALPGAACGPPGTIEDGDGE